LASLLPVVRRSAWSVRRSVMVAMLVSHPSPRAAWPSSGGRMKDAFGALLETISCRIVASLSTVLAAYIKATASGTVGVVMSCLDAPSCDPRTMPHGSRHARSWAEVVAAPPVGGDRSDALRHSEVHGIFHLLKSATTLVILVGMMLVSVKALIRVHWMSCCRKLSRLSWRCFVRRSRTLWLIRPKRIYFPEHFCYYFFSNLCVSNTTNTD
jgi:hypothetical protein